MKEFIYNHPYLLAILLIVIVIMITELFHDSEVVYREDGSKYRIVRVNVGLNEDLYVYYIETKYLGLIWASDKFNDPGFTDLDEAIIYLESNKCDD